MTEISFGASFKTYATVQKLVNGKYIPFKTSIVKAEQSDLESLAKTARAWKRPFACQMEQAIELSKYDASADIRNVYILTKQQNNFSRLIPKDILGMVYLYQAPKRNTLEYIQVHPDIELNNYPLSARFKDKLLKLFGIPKNNARKYLDIGSNLVKYLQKTYNDKRMELAYVRTTKNFYKKLGFKSEMSALSSRMVWVPKSSK